MVRTEIFPQSIYYEENVTLPFEMISIIFMQICNATPRIRKSKHSRRLSKSAQRQANGHVEDSPVPYRSYRKCCAFLHKKNAFFEVFIRRIQIQSSIILRSEDISEAIVLHSAKKPQSCSFKLASLSLKFD